MEEKDLINKLENLSVPNAAVKHQDTIKLMVLNSKKSAAIGIWLVAVPCFFLFCVFMKYFFHADLHLFSIVEEFFSSLDKDPDTKYLTPIFFVLLPLFAVVINALSIMHVEYNHPQKEINISIKLKFINIALIIVSGLILLTILGYAITENFVQR